MTDNQPATKQDLEAMVDSMKAFLKSRSRSLLWKLAAVEIIYFVALVAICIHLINR